MQEHPTTAFWLHKDLDEMTEGEWEKLCDCCGLCCLNKIIDNETNEIYYTNVACDQLDKETCSCRHYTKRFSYQPDCIKLTKENVATIPWLPQSCAYYLRLHHQPLPEWHPLLQCKNNALPKVIRDLRHRIVYEKDVICWEDHIIHPDWHTILTKKKRH